MPSNETSLADDSILTFLINGNLYKAYLKRSLSESSYITIIGTTRVVRDFNKPIFLKNVPYSFIKFDPNIGKIFLK